jgi:hypothetical protein
MSMRRLPSCLAGLCCLVVASPRALFADTYVPPPSDQELLTAKGHVVAAVTIEDVQPPIGTRGQPPRVSLRVEALIRGTLPQSRVVAAWAPPDYVGLRDERSPPAAWLAEPLSAPPPGTRLILLLSREDGDFRVSNRCRYPDTPQIRQQVRKAIDDYIAFVDRFRREQAEEAKVERARFEARKRSWRAAASPLLIARSARDADFIGIGRLSDGPNQGRATFEITEILKGARRKPYRGSLYFADVNVPPEALEVVDSLRGRGLPLFLFLTEHGMDLGGAPSYPLAGVGLVIADAEARRVVRSELARTRPPRPLPLCLALIGGHSSVLSPDDNRALQARIAEALVSAGRGRCNVARSWELSNPGSPDWIGAKTRELYLGADRAVLVSIDNSGGATLSGIRIGSDGTKVVFAGEPWPLTASAQRDIAQRLLERLVTAE